MENPSKHILIIFGFMMTSMWRPIVVIVYILRLGYIIASRPEKITYRKIPNISPGLIEVFKHFLGGLYSGGGLYSEGILC